MAVIDFSSRDVLRSTVVTPGYYKVKIQKVSEKYAKNGGSINYMIDEAEIIADENGGTKFSGVPTPFWMFNSKAPSFLIPFFEAITGHKIEGGSRMEFSSDALEGKELVVYIDNGTYQGRIVNVMTAQYKMPKV